MREGVPGKGDASRHPDLQRGRDGAAGGTHQGRLRGAVRHKPRGTCVAGETTPADAGEHGGAAGRGCARRCCEQLGASVVSQRGDCV